MAKKWLALILATVLALSAVSALAESTASDAQTPVTISYYSTQAGVDDATIEVLNAFMKEYPWITVNYYPCGDDQLAAWLALYAAGTAPTVSLLDVGQIHSYSQYMYNFNDGDTAWMSHVQGGFEYTTDAATGAILGVPSSFQGFGLLCNTTAVFKALGADYDIHGINTVDKLSAFFAALDAAGVSPTIVFSADWALAAHYLGCQLFSEWQGSKADAEKLMADLKSGNASLMDNEAFNNIMDVFDLMMKYNLNKADPLADMQESDCIALANGTAATMFQGDWNWLYLSEIDAKDRGDLVILPLPLTNDETDPRNSKILASCPKAYCVDIYQNTPEQQAAGKILAQWLALSPVNQQFMVEKVGSTLPFDNVTAVNANPLAVSTKESLDAGKVLDISAYICDGPSDFWEQVGPYMQAYLGGKMDRATLAGEIQDYFANLQ